MDIADGCVLDTSMSLISIYLSNITHKASVSFIKHLDILSRLSIFPDFWLQLHRNFIFTSIERQVFGQISAAINLLGFDTL